MTQTWPGLIGLVAALFLAFGCAKEPRRSAQEDGARASRQPSKGSLSTREGTATVRKSYLPQRDDPTTTNDESNDQPTGHFGTATLLVWQEESGNRYTLDVECDGLMARRIYFPRGGWVDLESCELDEDLYGECVDENGKHWRFEGHG